MTDPLRRRATPEDFWAIPEEERFHEFLGGDLVPKAAPTAEHADAQGGILGAIRSPYQRASGRGGPGGWWILPEVEVLVKLRPDWLCEVVSPGNAKRDTIEKLRRYHRAAVPYYWLVDPRDATLTVMRWSSDGYVTLLRAERGEVVHPEPFQHIEIAVGTLFGDDPPER